MCGIFGWIGANASDCHEKIYRIKRTLSHRGPDSCGSWKSNDGNVVFGHTRLSILDLTDSGSQPMVSRSKRSIISFNGEIYNYQQLKDELAKEGVNFTGRSDTEVLLEGFELHGPVFLERVIGMFAFAIWDEGEKHLYLARDRMGEKPLYYGWQSGYFVFASELKAIRLMPGFIGKIDRNAVSGFLSHTYIPAPYSVYDGLYKLIPSTYLKLPLDDLILKPDNFSCISDSDIQSSPQKYWSLRTLVEESEKINSSSMEQQILGLDDCLSATISSHLVADVPVGAFLSGGIDSSLVAAIMQKVSNKPIKTFTIGFTDPELDESSFAREISNHLGTEHTEYIVTPADALSVIPKLSEMYDEPFADSSQIPTYLVSQLARTEVTVALSGDGGDELFGGYPRYIWTDRISKLIPFIPSTVGRILSSAISCQSPARLNSIFKKLSRILPNNFSFITPGQKLARLIEVLDAKDSRKLYVRLLNYWGETPPILGSRDQLSQFATTSELKENIQFLNWMMWLDQGTYLPDDIMVKVDRASMAHSLETRAPFLDRRVVEAAWQLPLNMKIKNGTGKWILRQLLSKYIPTQTFERPKKGFGIPIGEWIREPLRDWAESFLDEKHLMSLNIFEPTQVSLKWKQHLARTHDWTPELWSILMFSAWQKSCE